MSTNTHLMKCLRRVKRNDKNDSNARSRRVPDRFVPSEEETAEKDNANNFNDDTDISAGIHIGNDMYPCTVHHFDALPTLLRLWRHCVQMPRCTVARRHSIDDPQSAMLAIYFRIVATPGLHFCIASKVIRWCTYDSLYMRDYFAYDSFLDTLSESHGTRVQYFMHVST